MPHGGSWGDRNGFLLPQVRPHSQFQRPESESCSWSVHPKEPHLSPDPCSREAPSWAPASPEADRAPRSRPPPEEDPQCSAAPAPPPVVTAACIIPVPGLELSSRGERFTLRPPPRQVAWRAGRAETHQSLHFHPGKAALRRNERIVFSLL